MLLYGFYFRWKPDQPDWSLRHCPWVQGGIYNNLGVIMLSYMFPAPFMWWQFHHRNWQLLQKRPYGENWEPTGRGGYNYTHLHHTFLLLSTAAHPCGQMHQPKVLNICLLNVLLNCELFNHMYGITQVLYKPFTNFDGSIPLYWFNPLQFVISIHSSHPQCSYFWSLKIFDWHLNSFPLLYICNIACSLNIWHLPTPS